MHLVHIVKHEDGKIYLNALDIFFCVQVPLQVSQPLDSSLLNGLNLGLDGDHQYLNAGLAIALCRTWLWKTGHFEDVQLDQAVSGTLDYCLSGILLLTKN